MFKVNNKMLFTVSIIMILLVGFTLLNISKFMPSYKTCKDDFQMINRCGCIPCSSGLINYTHAQNNCNQNDIRLNITGLPK